jgi:tetratricopeptide (TPR) repeat protein
MLGHAATDAGRWHDAIDHYEDAAVRFRRQGHGFGLGGVLADLASTHLRSGSPAEALPLALESRDLQRELGNPAGEALALAIAGYAQLDSDLPTARGLLAESTRLAHKLGYLHALVFSLNGLAVVAFRDGDVERAAAVFEAALTLRAEIGIEHDPEDALVAELRTEALALAGERGDELDLDRAVALALAE